MWIVFLIGLVFFFMAAFNVGAARSLGRYYVLMPSLVMIVAPVAVPLLGKYVHLALVVFSLLVGFFVQSHVEKARKESGTGHD